MYLKKNTKKQNKNTPTGKGLIFYSLFPGFSFIFGMKVREGLL